MTGVCVGALQWSQWEDPRPVHEDRIALSFKGTPGGEIQM